MKYLFLIIPLLTLLLGDPLLLAKDDQLSSELFFAVRANDEYAVQKLIVKGVDVD